MITGFEVAQCPFCRRRQDSMHLMRLRSMSQCYVRCICGACGPDGSNDEEAVKRWNERKGEQRVSGSVLNHGTTVKEMEELILRYEKEVAELKKLIPQPDPDWKDICEKCHDGEIEPHYCEYYGEPNGCNSPIYGEHPTAEKSSAVGNAAEMREALEACMDYLWRVDRPMNDVMRDLFKTAYDKSQAALAAPARNCDVYDAKTAEKEFIRQTGSKSIRSKSVRWLYAPYNSEAAESLNRKEM